MGDFGRTSMKRLAFGLAALIAAVGVAFGAGNFPNFPVVGGPAGCAGFSTGTTGQVCTDVIPAGPANIPPTAYFPADTGLPQGQNPATVNIPAVLMGGVSADFAPLTGTSITVPQGVNNILLDPAGTIATLTIVLPASTLLIDGQPLTISSSQTVTALTITAGSGTSIVATATTTIGPTTAAVTYIYHAASTKWTNG
jgi:hypothetical protein